MPFGIQTRVLRDSRRLQNASKNRVENGGFLRTPGDKQAAAKRCHVKPLAPETARHHQLRKTLLIKFDSRRLHHFSFRTRVRLPPPPPTFARLHRVRASVGEPTFVRRLSTVARSAKVDQTTNLRAHSQAKVVRRSLGEVGPALSVKRFGCQANFPQEIDEFR